MAHVDDERRRGLGADFLAAKDKAPTRPHPLAPDTGPVNAVAGALAAPIDKLRDAREDRARTAAAEEGRR